MSPQQGKKEMVEKQFLFGFGRPGSFLMGCNRGYRAHHSLLAHSVHDTVQSYGRPRTSFMGCNKFLLRLSYLNPGALKAIGYQKENP